MNVAVAAAADAVLEGRYADARRQLRRAGILLAGIPDGGKGTTRLEYDREAIDRMLEEVRRAEAEDAAAEPGTADGGGLLEGLPVEYVRT